MKNFKTYMAAVIMMALSTSAWAQGGGIWNFDWNIAFPMGSTTDFVDQPAARGFSIEGQGYVTDRATIGGLVAWNVFYQNNGWQSETVGETGTVYGYQRRYLNVMPIMATAHYYFSTSSIMPYVGVGLGTYYIESRDFMGIYYEQGKDWHFGAAPEAGVVMYLGEGSNTGLNLGFKYNWAAKTKNEAGQSWLGINVGISYLF